MEEKIDYNRIQYDNYEYIQKEGTKVVEKQVVKMKMEVIR